MLRIIQNSHAAGAKSYYGKSDYYTKDQELPGVWRGKAADQLGLRGEVKQSDWDPLCENVNPATSKPLTARNRDDRTVGYDFNFHVPKSVSLYYALTKDERVLEAFRDAVRSTMEDMEAEMQTRVRRDGKNEDRTTGNMIWGEFIHFTSRPVDGLPDPHLHAHCFVFNSTFDEQEQVFKAGQFRSLKRDAPYFEAVFHSRLGLALATQGFGIERNAKGWEIEGVGKKLIKQFSRRATQIEDIAREKGGLDAVKKASLGATTRSKKMANLSFADLQSAWKDRLSPDESEQIRQIRTRRTRLIVNQDLAANQGLEYATLHSFERNSVVPERTHLALAIKRTVGLSDHQTILAKQKTLPLIRGVIGGRNMVTTSEVLAEEQRAIEFAKKGRGRCFAFRLDLPTFTREWLNASQKAAVAHVLTSNDRVILVRGAAGVGKTTLMQETVEAVRSAGHKVFAFAPSAEASRGVLRDAGFVDADTVAKLLADKQLQQQVAGSLIWIDEAGLLGMKTLSHVFELAEKVNARVLLTGDRKQHHSVERGDALRILETDAGLRPAEVKEIQRQAGEYKFAVKALSEGRVVDGFEKLNKMGWIREIADDERYKVMAHDYIDSVERGQSALVVSPTHAEEDRITSEIRQGLKSKGRLAKEDRSFMSLEGSGITEAERSDAVNYEPGDVIQFHQNAKGFKRGQRIEVNEPSNLPLLLASRFQHYRCREIKIAVGDRIRITANGMTADGQHRLNNGSLYTVGGFTENGNIILKENKWEVSNDFGHFTYGYVVTSHASQGKSVKNVFIGQASQSFGASSKEQFYVSVSRGEQSATIYTDDKQSLLEAVQQSDDRVSASELVKQTIRSIPVHSREQRSQDKARWQDATKEPMYG